MPREKKKPEMVKFRTFKEVKLSIPKNPFLYKLRRIQWLLANYSKQLEKDPTSISLKEYLLVLDEYEKLTELAHKKGLDTNAGRKAAAGVVPKGVGTSRDEGEADSSGDLESLGMGAGV
jgi:hypothetical protein